MLRAVAVFLNFNHGGILSLGMIQRALRVLPSDLFWVNPDCGLKTRTKEESVAALRQMVQAAQAARATLSVSS